ncbi:MAG: POT family MFS transporter [Polyangiales bacterium]
MTNSKFRTAPEATSSLPHGIPYIIGNEAAERFSFYGMKGILFVFMTKYLLDAQGGLDLMSKPEATRWFHLFTGAVYLTPLFGAFLADYFWGKYRTIILLSIVYCLGHLTLAIDDTRSGLALGLGLIAVGAGGIKPCVSAHVGDQFGAQNSHWVERVFGWFYIAINVGSFLSMLITPWLLEHYGPSYAFALPGVLMALATLVFWMGRNKFVHIPPAGNAFIEEVKSREGLAAIAKLVPIYAFIAMFWSLFDQTGSSWVDQAKSMNLHLGIEWLPSQIQAINPVLILVLTPLFATVIYPFVNRFVRVTPLRKIGVGLFITVPAFLVPAWVESRIQAGEVVSIGWQILSYVLMTTAEVLVSITALEFSYTQAPKKMKSLIMGIFFSSVFLGNVFTAGVNYVIENPDGSSSLTGASYYLFFAAMMFITAVLFVPFAMRFKEKTYIQDEETPA